MEITEMIDALHELRAKVVEAEDALSVLENGSAGNGTRPARGITADGRERLRQSMKQRWAVKRAHPRRAAAR